MQEIIDRVHRTWVAYGVRLLADVACWVGLYCVLQFVLDMPKFAYGVAIFAIIYLSWCIMKMWNVVREGQHMKRNAPAIAAAYAEFQQQQERMARFRGEHHDHDGCCDHEHEPECHDEDCDHTCGEHDGMDDKREDGDVPDWNGIAGVKRDENDPKS